MLSLSICWRRSTATGRRNDGDTLVGTMTRADLHRLVDELPNESIDSAAVVLDRIRDPFWGALLSSPPDDEPFTAEERAAVEAARRQPGISQEELLADIDPD